MADQFQSPARLAFGPFEVNTRTEKLFKRGVRIRIPAQPFQILCLLLVNPGQIVTREELRERIWNDGRFVDFEHSLNVAVNRLRRALQDSAENPRYIATEPGRGYRFIAPVQEVKLDAISDEPALATAITETARTPKTAWVVAAAALAAITVAGIVFFQLHRAPALTGKDTIVLADIQNTTGDPVFDGMLRQGLIVQLEQSPFLSLVSEERIQQQLRLMGKPADVRLTPQVALEICIRTGSAAMLEGSITKLGIQYVLALSAKSCSSGEPLDDEQIQVARKEDVLDALSRIARKFRSRAGESFATIEKHEMPLAEATTPSLEALKAYSTGWKISFSGWFSAAVPHLQRAIQIDPNFAMAYAFLASLYGSTGESVLAAESISKAYELRERASDHERFFIVLSYDLLATGNLEKAQQSGELWAQTYPRDAVPHGILSWVYQLLGKYESAAEEAEKGIDRDPDFVFGYNNLVWTSVYLNRLSEAENALQRASTRKLEAPDFSILHYYIAFLKNDAPGQERAALEAKEKPGIEDWISHEEAFVLGYSGHLQHAIRMSQRAVELAQQANKPERAALYQAGAAVLEAFLGNSGNAARNAMAALGLSRGRDVQYGAAFALALAGDDSRAQTLANDLAMRFPNDTLVGVEYLPTLRAVCALKHRKPSAAIELLQTAAPQELATPGSWFGFFGNLYPIYVRGTAYLAKGQAAEAAMEFRKIIGHPSLVFCDPVGPSARLQLARALVLAGDKAKAKIAYQDFLARWKDADADIPILRQAKTEYTRLE